MTEDAKKLYTDHTNHYDLFVSLGLYEQGLTEYFASSTLLKPEMRVLDAGCGTGILTFALLKAINAEDFEVGCINGFDLTPAMLRKFRNKLTEQSIDCVDLREADVLDPDSLPEQWTGYDLVMTASMLEYIPRDQLFRALQNLKQRMSENGRFVLFITKENLLNRYLIEKLWSANTYSKTDLADALSNAGFVDIDFQKFPMKYGWLNWWGHIVEARAR